jgi:ATP-dependent DNA helicase RecG
MAKMNGKPKLGRLKSLGIDSVARVALFLPKKHIDLRNVVKNADGAYKALLIAYERDVVFCFSGLLANIPPIDTAPKQMPRIQCTILLDDDQTPIKFTIFDTRKNLEKRLDTWKESQQSVRLVVSGFPKQFGSSVWLNGAEIQPDEFIGRILPVYAGKAGVVKPENTRILVLNHLDESIPMAADILRQGVSGVAPELMQSICDPAQLELILREAHTPTSMRHQERAAEILDRLAALISKNKLMTHLEHQGKWSESARIDVTRWHEVATRVPFELTEEQVHIINDIAAELNRASALRGMLQGDVGTGKTVTFGIPAITAALSGHKVAVMLPNTGLANQVYVELVELMEESERHRAELITGDTKKPIIRGKNLIVGTTAILFAIEKEHPELKFDLTIIDEQQKFSRQQREKLLSEKTHLLEVSATPIPRSVALAKYGAMKVWRLRKCHTEKIIESKLLTSHHAGKDGLKTVFDTVAAGNQALLVYALKEDSESEVMEGIVSAEKAYSWWEKRFPGRVRLVHSKMDDDDKKRVLNEMKAGDADILVSTTVIEVGVTIPGAMTMAVFNAERFGLVTLHQLRGRLARKGNRGGVPAYFLMKTKDNPSPSTVERLQVMLETTDGYEIAEKDLALRGYGDLGMASETQSGADESILIGRKIDPVYLEEIMAMEVGNDTES